MTTITNKRHKPLTISLILGLLSLLVGGQAQSDIHAMAVQDDGKIFITGEFLSNNGVSRRNLARLRPNVIVDLAYNVELDFWGNALAIQSDGKLIVGGRFTSVSDASDSFDRNRIARLNADGSLDLDFDPDFNSDVHAVLVQDDGKILIAGNFTRIGGVLRQHLARLNTDGSIDDSFADPGVGKNVRTMVLQDDGKIVIGGSFTSVDGEVRNRVARLNSDGSLDTTFVGPEVDDDVLALAIQDDDKIIVGGDFRFIGQLFIPNIARLEADGSLDAAFKFSNPVGGDLSISDVDAIAIQDDGKILVGGIWFRVQGQDMGHLVRLQENGNIDLDFDPTVVGSSSATVKAVVIEDDGKILIAGSFTQVGGSERSSVARLNIDGSVDGLSNEVCTAIKSVNGAVAVVCL